MHKVQRDGQRDRTTGVLESGWRGRKKRGAIITVRGSPTPVDRAQLYQMLEDGTIANEQAKWVPSFLEGKSRGWFLSMAVWHMAEHLLGGVVCVRRVSGIPVGL